MQLPGANVALLLLLGARSIAASRFQQERHDSEAQWWLTMGDTIESSCSSALALLSSYMSNNVTQAEPAQLASVKSHNSTEKRALRASKVNDTSVVKEAKLGTNQTTNHTANHTANRTEKLQTELGNLQNLFSHLKSRIGTLNKDEHNGHDEDDKMIQEQEDMIHKAQVELNWTNLTKWQRQIRVNRTKGAQAELVYWKRHRELSHGSFHANLKMSHGLMDKVHQTMNLFHKLLEGKKIDTKDLEAIRRGLPSAKASFVQMVSSYFSL
jgi:hypothetical protein